MPPRAPDLARAYAEREQRAGARAVHDPRREADDVADAVHGAPDRPEEGDEPGRAQHGAGERVCRRVEREPGQQQREDADIQANAIGARSRASSSSSQVCGRARGDAAEIARDRGQRPRDDPRQQQHQRKREPLPPQQLLGAGTQQHVGDVVADPAIGELSVPAVDARDRGGRELPGGGAGPRSADHQDGLAIDGADDVGVLRLAVRDIPFRPRRHPVEVDGGIPFGGRAQLARQIGPAGLLIGGEPEIP